MSEFDESTIDEVLRHPRRDELNDCNEYQRLRSIQATKPLSESEKKRYMRVRLRLRKSGMIRPVNRSNLRDRAKEMYMALPWHKRLWLRLKFRWTLLRIWMGGSEK
jgi:hypothetical protein